MTRIGLRTAVDGHYVLTASNQVRFALGPYDRNQPLVIDPVLSYSTYLGGSGLSNCNGQFCGDGSFGIAVDSSGSAYVTGFTQSLDFPTQGPFQHAPGASSAQNAFVAKLSADGSSLVYATYLGGSNDDFGYSIAADDTGAYVAGSTSSPDFPLQNALTGQTTFTGSRDAFVAKLSADGSSLVYSTYLVGNSVQEALGIAINSGSAYVTGYTASTDFKTVHPLSGYGSLKGTENPFVARLDWTPTPSPQLSLVYSTILGGTNTDQGYAIAADSAGNVYVTGATTSTNFPLQSPLAGYGSLHGIQNAFVTELNWTGAALNKVYSTYLGGTAKDEGFGIALDSSGSAYVTGATTSTNFPLSLNPFQATNKTQIPVPNAGTGTVFVSRLDWSAPTLTLGYSTYLGGSTVDFGYGIATDSSKNAYVTRVTGSADFPPQNPLPLSLNSTYGHVFVTKLSVDGSSLVYSTLLGGSGNDFGYAIAVDSSANPNAYVTGKTWSTDFPTFNAVQTTNKATPTSSNNSTGFVTKISPLPAPTASLSATSIPDFGSQVINSSPSSPKSVTLNNTSSGPLTIASITISGEFALDSSGTCPYTGGTVLANSSCTIAVTFDPTTVGAQAGTVTITDNSAGIPAKQTVSVSGTGTAASSGASLSTPSAFAAQAVGTTSSPQTITLTNNGTSSLAISGFVPSGPFGVAPSGTTCSALTPVAANGGTCTISVTFTPTTTGTATGSLTVTDNASNSPQSVSLTGTGVTPGGVSLSTPSAFAGQFVGTTSSAQTVTLTNGGSASLTISAIGVTGPFNLVASGTTCSTSTPVAANGTCTVAVTVSPTATGAAAGSLSITDNGAGSPHSASLSGTGWDFTLAVASGSNSTQTVAPGAAASYTLTLTGLGGFNQTVTFSCTGAPSEATCSAPSTSASSTGTSVTVSVTTTAPSMIAPLSRRLPPARPLLPGPGDLVVLALFLAGIAWAVRSWRQTEASRLRIALVALALGMLLTLAIAACGGGGGGTGPAPNPGTPAGTSTLTVTGTGTAGTGSTTKTHTQSLTLTVS